MKTIEMRLTVLVFFCLVLAGCLGTMPQQITSLHVNCDMKDIKITDESVELNGTEKWTAQCDGKRYYCTHLLESGSDCYELED